MCHTLVQLAASLSSEWTHSPLVFGARLSTAIKRFVHDCMIVRSASAHERRTASVLIRRVAMEARAVEGFDWQSQ